MITWKLPSFEGAIESKEDSMHDNSLNVSGNPEPVEDIFGAKGATGSQDQSINVSAKVDERTSLLPDGTLAPGKSKSLEDQASKGDVSGNQKDSSVQEPEED